MQDAVLGPLGVEPGVLCEGNSDRLTGNGILRLFCTWAVPMVTETKATIPYLLVVPRRSGLDVKGSGPQRLGKKVPVRSAQDASEDSLTHLERYRCKRRAPTSYNVL